MNNPLILCSQLSCLITGTINTPDLEMRILIVEDNPVTRLMIERNLEKWGYEVVSVNNINAAISIILTEQIQFVITDWIMPGGNGTELCQRVRSENLPFYTYMILVTALDGTDTTVQGMESGADDFIRKPFELNELRARILSGERILVLEKNLKETNNQLLAAREVINRDLKMAADIQRSLLPHKNLTDPDLKIDWIFHPSTHLSGDIFNVFPLDNYRYGFYIIDVAGHGVASAMLSFTLSRLLTPDTGNSNLLRFSLADASAKQFVRQSADVIAKLNQKFQTNSENILYFTMTYGTIDTKSRTLDLCQAGHPYAIYQQKGNCSKFVVDSGPPVGIITDVTYQSVRISYTPGDRLFLYSDGITECESPDGVMFGTERLSGFVDANKDLEINEIIQNLDQTICEWRQGNDFEDDISMLILEIF